MADFFRFDQGWHLDDPRVRLDSEVPAGLTPDTPLETMPTPDNEISVAMTEEQVTAFLAKLAEAAAMLPPIPEKTDAQLKRLLGVDESTELDEIAEEALAAHPDWKPVKFDPVEFAKDGANLATTAPMPTPVKALERKIRVMRRLAAHDRRKATLRVYAVIQDLAAGGDPAAQEYEARMSAFFERDEPAPPGGGTPNP